MEFSWDPKKAARNLKDHKVSFEEAATIFGEALAITFNDPDHSVGEHRLLTFGACLGIAVVLSACSVNHAGKANFDRCLANDRGCDSALLTGDEQQLILDWHEQRHFEDCMAGLRCKERSLTEEEKRQVREAALQRNFQACLRGESSCETAMLTDSQRIEVELADRVRNFEFCLGGLTVCDQAALTDRQRAAVRTAYLERNYLGCMNAVGTLVRCNPDDLSGEQREWVRRRTLKVNLYVCTNGIVGCDEGLLTPEQRAQIRAYRLGLQ